jgi:hypothetical protein
LPFYFRKRPGSKNVKANITQRGLRSFTFTSGSKKGQPRLNFNTSRGWSFSFPGTGIMWRQKGYGNSKYKSVVDERGYDLRTKEGRAQHEENKAIEAIITACVIVGALGWWLTESPHGAWAGYILFWISIAIKNDSPATLVWAFFVHLFAIVGYGISLLFDTSSYEPAIWGAVVGNFVSAHLTKNMGFNIFLSCLFLGCWAFFGEPSVYFSDLAERAVGTDYIGLSPIDFSIDLSHLNLFFEDTLNQLLATDGQINPLFFTLNIYASIALFFGYFRWGTILWSTAINWASNGLALFLLRLIGLLVFFVSNACVMTLAMAMAFLFYDHLPSVVEKAFNNYPIMVFFLWAFSTTLGIIINANLRREKGQERNFWPIVFQCAVTLFWLPALSHKPTQNPPSNTSESINVSETESSKEAVRGSEHAKKQKVNVTEDQGTPSQADKYLRLSREKIEHQELGNVLKGVVGLGRKRQSALVQAYPNPKEILEASDIEINSRTGLGSKLIARVKLALEDAQKANEVAILNEYLAYVFPLKSRPRKLTLNAFCTFEQLHQFCKDPDDTLTALSKNDLSKLIQVTLIQDPSPKKSQKEPITKSDDITSAASHLLYKDMPKIRQKRSLDDKRRIIDEYDKFGKGRARWLKETHNIEPAYIATWRKQIQKGTTENN